MFCNWLMAKSTGRSNWQCDNLSKLFRLSSNPTKKKVKNQLEPKQRISEGKKSHYHNIISLKPTENEIQLLPIL